MGEIKRAERGSGAEQRKGGQPLARMAGQLEAEEQAAEGEAGEHHAEPVEALALVALVFDPRAVVLGTLACAALAMGSFYGAFEGFDEALRRPR